jgi:hypothetical protein
MAWNYAVTVDGEKQDYDLAYKDVRGFVMGLWMAETGEIEQAARVAAHAWDELGQDGYVAIALTKTYEIESI